MIYIALIRIEAEIVLSVDAVSEDDVRAQVDAMITGEDALGTVTGADGMTYSVEVSGG